MNCYILRATKESSALCSQSGIHFLDDLQSAVWDAQASIIYVILKGKQASKSLNWDRSQIEYWCSKSLVRIPLPNTTQLFTTNSDTAITLQSVQVSVFYIILSTHWHMDDSCSDGEQTTSAWNTFPRTVSKAKTASSAKPLPGTIAVIKLTVYSLITDPE